jgi:4-hydroxy-3-polyprenylbenzoate decarboxylase
MTYNSLSDFIHALEKDGELIRINERINPELEITEIAERVMKSKAGGKALLFENNGTEFPVLINMMGNEARMLRVLRANNYKEITKEIEVLSGLLLNEIKAGFFKKLKLLPSLIKMASYMPGKTSKKAPCQQIINKEVNLNNLPILKTWPHDGGKFITLPIVITQNPDTGTRNAGMYRMQVLDEKSTGMHWHMHKGGAAHYDMYKARNEKMPVAVVLGGDPVYTYCATAPLPDGIDEFLMAGYLRKKKVKMVKCISQDIYVPSDADIVIEGYIDNNEEMVYEGPFGDHTGFYSLADYYPKFHVTCITHRKDAVYPATVVGVPPMEDAEIARATERIFLYPLKMMQQEIIDMHIPELGVAHNLVLIKIKKSFPGQGMKVLHSLLGSGQMMFSKVLIALPESVDIFNMKQVANHVLKSVNISDNISFSSGPADVLDHASNKFAFSGKVLIDATDTKTESVNSAKIEFKTDLDFVENVKISDNTGWIFVNKVNYKCDGKIIDVIANNLDNENLPILINIIDNIFNIDDFNFLTWLVLSNIDPKKDVLLIENSIFVDASIKNKRQDGFERDWPNIVAMDKAVIDKIDKLWGKLGIGDFIESPSNGRLNMQSGDGAVYE